MANFTKLVILIAFFILQPFSPCTIEAISHEFAPSGKKPLKHILLIHSYNPSYEWTRNLTRGVLDTLEKKHLDNVSLDIEYMDARRYPQKSLRDNFIQLLQTKYTGVNKPDIIIAADNLAYELLKEKGEDIFGQTPTVFCGVNGYTGKNVRYAVNVTGAVDNPMNLVETVWLTRRLQPKAKKLLVLSDNTVTGKALMESFDVLSANTNIGFANKDVEFLPEVTYDELFKLVANLDSDTAVLYTIFTHDRNGTNRPMRETTRLLSHYSHVPIFTSVGMNVGNGVVGGKVSNGYVHGTESATQASQILDGVKPIDIPIATNLEMPYVFDQKQLERFNIRKSQLPPDSVYINTNHFWELFDSHYNGYTITAIIAIVIQLSLIFLLLANRKKLVNMQNLLQHSRRLYMSLVNNSPVYVCRCSPGGKLTFANLTFSEFFSIQEEQCRRDGLHAICPSDEQEGFKDFIRQMTHNTPSRFYEHTVTRNDGQPRHLRWVGRAVYDQNGKAETIQLVGEDITDIRLAYQSLQKEEERFRMVADYTNNWEYWLSAENKLLYMSPSCQNFTGFTRDEFFLNPQLLEDLVLPEDKSLFCNGITHNGNVVTFTFRLRQRDGNVIWIEQVNQRVHDSNGSDLGQRISNRDITDKKNAENALLTSERNLRSIIHAINDALITFDDNSAIINLNKSAEDFCGISLSSALGKKFSDLFPIQDKDSGMVYHDLPDRVFSGSELPGQYRPASLILKGPRDRIVSITGAILNNSTTLSGAQRSALIILRDETRQRQVETQLHYAQKMEAIGQLAGGVAHDFNNMLGGIIGAAELLYNTTENQTADKYSKIIIRTAERAASLTSQLLSFARRNSEVNSVIDMHQIINEACDILERSIDKKIVLNVSLDAADTIISGDPSQLENAIINLGLNARDSMPDGGQLLLRTENVFLDSSFCNRQPQNIEPGYYIQICVSDTGHGIPDDIMDRIFDPFFTTKDVGKGTGLGLAAVYGIMLEHKGTIRVSSHPNSGSEFFLLLPVDGNSTLTEEEVEDIPLTGGRILLADDEEVIRYTAKILLESCGYEVITAENGKEAVNIFSHEKDDLDLVILDIIMPEMDGTQAFQEIRKISNDAKILICSGYLQDDNMKKLKEIGATHFTRKPYRKSHIMHDIYKCLAEAPEGSDNISQ